MREKAIYPLTVRSTGAQHNILFIATNSTPQNYQ